MAEASSAGPRSAARPRLGLAVPLEGLGLLESLELAAGAGSLGYTDVWSYEVSDSDGFTPLAWLASRTDQIRLGISVIPAFTRPPALLAMTSAALQEVSGGRFVLGLGSSAPNVVERWMGGAYERPLTRVRETVEAIRLVLAGGKASYQGETVRVEDFRLALPPASVPIVLGALGPKMRRLAGEAGDGIVTVFNTAESTPELLEDFYDGARASGRDPRSLDVVSKLFVAVDEDDEALREMLRRFITGYATVPAYNRLLAGQGFEAEAARLAEAWADGRRREASEAITDEMLERLIVFGSADECARRLGSYPDAGVTTVIVAPVSAVTDPDERRRRLINTVEQVGGRLAPARA